MRRHAVVCALWLVLAGLLFAGGAGAAAPAPGEREPVIELETTGAGRANALAYSSDGQTLAVGTATGLVLYDAHTQQELRFIPIAGGVRGLAFSPDGRLLAAGGYAPDLTLWRVANGALVRRFVGHASWVRSVAFSPDGQTLLSASDDQTLRWWRVSDGRLQRTLAEGMAGIRVVALSPDGQTVAVGGQDGQVRLLRFSDGGLLRALPGHTDWIRCLAFSPDGQTLASGAFDATARLWRVRDGAPLFELRGHTFSVLGVAFAPDGQTLATGSVDGTIALWRVEDARLRHVLSGHTDFVFAVAYAPDGQTLASGAGDNTVRLWAVGPDAGRVPLAERPPAVPSTSCVQCHHPRGDFLRPGGVTEAPPVAEVACAACHTAGALVLHWCPAFPRAAGATERHGSAENLSNQVGVPRGTRDFALVLAAPGNGEHYYVPQIHTVLPVSGLVLGAATDNLEVRLEVWSGGTRTGSATTRTDADGRFSFSTDLRPNGIVLEVPIEERECVMCHSETLAETPALPPGDVRLVVSAVSATGQTATDERWITVDRSQMVVAAVTLVPAQGAAALPPLTVTASTRLYGWRGRSFTGATGAGGAALLPVEALAEVAADYVFEVPPVVIDGVRYASLAPVTVTVPAGALALPPVSLTVTAQRGQIHGQVTNALGAVPVRAIHWPDGAAFAAQTDDAGAFRFEAVPLGEYLVLADPQALAAHGLAAASQRVDLGQTPEANVVLPAAPLRPGTAQGVVLDDTDRPLPFAWVSAGLEGTTAAVSPEDGAWWLAGLETDHVRSLVATAPGYYSQAVAWPEDRSAPVRFHLRPRPGLQTLPWGTGTVFLPPETRASVDGLHVNLAAGWLWGQGSGAQPVVIETAGVTLTVQTGPFALESVAGKGAWLYLFAGQAEASRDGPRAQTVRLAANSLLALGHPGPLVVVPLDPVVIQALRPAAAAPPVVWAPTLREQAANRLALLGVTAAQLVTFVTYMLVLLALFMVPLVRLMWWLRHGVHREVPTHD